MTFLRKSGGEVDAAKGESDARLEARVTRTASILGPLVKTVVRSEEEDGVPFMIVRPGASGMEEGLRASAVTVWSGGVGVSEWGFLLGFYVCAWGGTEMLGLGPGQGDEVYILCERASASTRLPVLPDAPKMRKCIL